MSNIFVFHGDNIAASRQAFVKKIAELTGPDTEVIRIEGKNLDENLIQTTINSPSMFKTDRLIVVENLFALSKSDAKEAITKFSQVTDRIIVIWEAKEVETKGYPATIKFQSFKLPNELFSLLDQLSPTNIATTLSQLERVKEQVDENFVFLMFARQIRLLILAKGGETSGLKPWLAAKLKKQALNFTDSALFDIYRQLRDIDYRQKTSQSTTDYLGEIQFLISNF